MHCSWEKIPDNEYIYAYLKDDKWIISTVKYARSKLLLTKKFYEDNILNKKIIETKKVIIKDKPNDESYEELQCTLDKRHLDKGQISAIFKP